MKEKRSVVFFLVIIMLLTNLNFKFDKYFTRDIVRADNVTYNCTFEIIRNDFPDSVSEIINNSNHFLFAYPADIKVDYVYVDGEVCDKWVYVYNGTVHVNLNEMSEGVHSINICSNEYGVAIICLYKKSDLTEVTSKEENQTTNNGETSENRNEDLEKGYLPSINGWGFSNYSVETISKQLFFRLYDSSKLYNKHLYEIKKNAGSGGMCEGLALSTALIYQNNPAITSFGKSNATNANQYKEEDKSVFYSKSLDMTIDEFIQTLWLYQFSKESSLQEKNNKGKCQQIIDKTKLFSLNNNNPIAIVVKGPEGVLKSGGHVLIPYKVEENDNIVKVFVYDCNYIALGENADEQYVCFKRDDSGKIKEWKYELWPGLEWNSSQLLSSITYIENFDIVSTILEGDNTVSTNNFLFTSNAFNYEIVQENGKTMQVDNGIINGYEESDWIQIANNNLLINGESEENSSEPDMFYISDNSSFKIVNDSSENVETSLIGEDTGIDIKSDGKSIVNVGTSESEMGAEIYPSKYGENSILFENNNESISIESYCEAVMSASMDLQTNNIKVQKKEDVVVSIIKDGDAVKKYPVNTDSNNIEINWSGDRVIIKEDSDGDGSYDQVIVNEKINEDVSSTEITNSRIETTTQQQVTTKCQEITKTKTTEISTIAKNSKIYVNKLAIKGKRKIKIGKKISLKATFKPKNATNKKVKWLVSNKKYAMISKNGVFKAKRKGKGKTVVVTCKTLDGSRKVAKFKIKISK